MTSPSFFEEVQLLLVKEAKTHNYDRTQMSDLEEHLDNIRINAHFMHLDNTSMHPAHRRLFKVLEDAADAPLAEKFEKQAISSFSAEVRRLLGEAVGEASMCWDPPPGKQVFDSTRAAEIVDRLAPKLKLAKSLKSFCKKCGKEHVPVCNQCGKKLGEGPDFRSMHGPCDRCAFRKTAMPSFLDELEKIALQPGYPQAVLHRAATTAVDTARAIPRQIGQGAGAFLTPKSSFQKGWQATFHPNGKPLGLGWKGFMAYGALSGANQALRKEDPTGRGHSRVRRVLRFAGDQAGGIIGAPFGLAGGITSSLIGAKAGDTLGRGLERAVGYRPQPHLPPPPQR